MTPKMQLLRDSSKPGTEHSRLRVTTRESTTHLQRANEVLEVQHGAGNLAVQRLLQTRVIQAKLKVGQPGDRYEQEADLVAEQVVLMPEPGASKKTAMVRHEQDTPIRRMCPSCEDELHRQVAEKVVSEQVHGARIQRVCAGCEEERGRKPPAEEEGLEELLQTKESPRRISTVTPGLESGIRALRGGGQPLPESVRAFFEPRFWLMTSHTFAFTRKTERSSRHEELMHLHIR